VRWMRWRLIRISAESDEMEWRFAWDADLLESNQVDLHPNGTPRASPNARCCRARHAAFAAPCSSRILRRDLASLPDGPRVEASLLPGLVEQLRAGQGVFERTGGLHAAGLFTAAGELVHVREDIGRHNAVDKVVGRSLIDGALPLSDSILVVSGRARLRDRAEGDQRRHPLLAAVGAPSSLAVSLAREFKPDPGRLSPR